VRHRHAEAHPPSTLFVPAALHLPEAGTSPRVTCCSQSLTYRSLVTHDADAQTLVCCAGGIECLCLSEA
jgi:hypothetical protein